MAINARIVTPTMMAINVPVLRGSIMDQLMENTIQSERSIQY